MNVFTPIKQKKIAEEIVDQLKRLIFEGQLKPGQKLPSERDLANSLNVSRVSLREALNTLQGMGLLEIQRGNRTFVRPMTTRSVYDPLVAFTKTSPANMFKVFELRKYLELGCVSLAAERATAEDVKILQRILSELQDDFNKNRLGAKADLDFHNAITGATHNEAYIHVMSTIYDLLQEELRIAWGGVFKKRESRKKLFQQHRNIFEAVQAHDPERGSKEALVHLNFVEEHWQNALLKTE